MTQRATSGPKSAAEIWYGYQRGTVSADQNQAAPSSVDANQIQPIAHTTIAAM